MKEFRIGSWRMSYWSGQIEARHSCCGGTRAVHIFNNVSGLLNPSCPISCHICLEKLPGIIYVQMVNWVMENFVERFPK